MKVAQLTVMFLGLALFTTSFATSDAEAQDGREGAAKAYQTLYGALAKLPKAEPRQYSRNEFLTNWAIRGVGDPTKIKITMSPEQRALGGVDIHQNEPTECRALGSSGFSQRPDGRDRSTEEKYREWGG